MVPYRWRAALHTLLHIRISLTPFLLTENQAEILCCKEIRGTIGRPKGTNIRRVRRFLPPLADFNHPDSNRGLVLLSHVIQVLKFQRQLQKRHTFSVGIEDESRP